MTVIMARINYEYKGAQKFTLTKAGHLQAEQTEDAPPLSSTLMARVKIVNESNEQSASTVPPNMKVLLITN